MLNQFDNIEQQSTSIQKHLGQRRSKHNSKLSKGIAMGFGVVIIVLLVVWVKVYVDKEKVIKVLKDENYKLKRSLVSKEEEKDNMNKTIVLQKEEIGELTNKVENLRSQVNILTNTCSSLNKRLYEIMNKLDGELIV